MVRFLLTVVVAAAIFGGIAWYAGVFTSEETNPYEDNTTSMADEPADEPKDEDPGPRLYKGPAIDAEPAPALSATADPIILPNYHVVSKEVVNVPCRYDGKLLFVGTEISKKEAESRRDQSGRYLDPFVPIYFGKSDPVYIFYKPLEEGAVVREDQMLALVDPTLARNQLAIKVAKLKAAESEFKGAVALRDVYRKEYNRLAQLRADKTQVVSDSEYQIAKAQYLRFLQEAIGKREAITVAQKEVTEAETIDMLHAIRVPFQKKERGAKPHFIKIKTVYRHAGESVKTLDPVLQVIDLNRLRAEGLVGDQFLGNLKEDMEVIVESAQRRKPIRTFRGHRGEVLAVAVSGSDTDPMIVSGGADETARVWKRNLAGEYLILPHYSAVRSVACSPRTAKGVNYCLTGCEDGTVRLWDLAKDYRKEKEPKPLWVRKRQHTDAVNCVAISPDGQWYASAGEDSQIILGETRTGKVKYHFDSRKGHQGAVTSVHFTPDLKLVSAGRDNTVRVWVLHEKLAKTDSRKALTNRGGSITKLGISPNGKWLLFDEGKTIKVLSLAGGRTVGVIKDPAQPTPFETLALFSPDSSLVLTASSTDEGLQLWRAPTDGERAYEVRRFVSKSGSPVTCGAFGEDVNLKKDVGDSEPDADRVFAATGNRDGQVYLWAVPNRALANKRIKGKISLRENIVDPSTHQARIWVDVDNPDGLLKPGETVTIVVPPPGKKGK
jgi:WD40 repeat protein